ncbi:MAG TPA: MFS transporter [Ignavibacteria bacterium]|nr:MFS transporter [Ignavibacteria bacterium]
MEKVSALKIKEFKFFLLTRLSMVLATQMQAVIVGWQVYEITKDPFSLGLIGLAEAIPSILISLYAGHVVDRNDRKKIIFWASLGMIFCSVSLLFISTNISSLLADNRLVLIYSVIFLSGIARGYLSPANFAFLAQIVPREIYPNAISWNTSNWQFGMVVGPALGGLIYGFAGVTAAYAVDALLTFASIGFLMMIKSKPVPDFNEEESLKDSLTAGVKFVFKNKIILGAISLDLFAVLFGGAVAILPIYAGEILLVGPEGLGALRAAPAVGAVMMAIYMTRRPLTKNAGRNLLVTVFLFGLSMMIFGISKSFYLSLFALALSGAFDAVSVVIRSLIIQLKTPDNMKGRVSSVDSIFVGSSNEIGAFESGLMAKLMGTVPSVVFNSVMTLIVVVVIAAGSPKLRKLKL